MQGFVQWWCNLIGISDPLAVSIATGATAASILWAIGYLALTIILAGIANVFRS